MGKTTTAINLAASLASAERKVLLVDMDPQGNAGSGLGLKRDALHGTVYDALLADRPMAELVHGTELRFLQVVPSTPDLTGAEIELVNLPRREYRLREALRPLVARLRLHHPRLPALARSPHPQRAHRGRLGPHSAAVRVLRARGPLPAHADRRARAPGLNPSLATEGILLTMFDVRANIAHQVASDVRAHFKDLVFESVVPRNVRLSECPSFGKPILLYDIKSKGCESYLALGHEILRRDQGPTDRRAA